MNKKPKALAFAHPFEGRTSYFLAGLSHFYELEVLFPVSKQFKYAWQVFYKWQYANDVKFARCDTLDKFRSTQGNYEAVFLTSEAFYYFYPFFTSQKEILQDVLAIKPKTKKIFWLQVGEHQFFHMPQPEFWDNIDAMLKGQVFKKEYEYLQKDLSQISKFQDPKILDYPELVKQNLEFDFEKYRHKILPFPFTPTITEPKDLNFANQNKIYDISANTRTSGNGALRYEIIKLLQKSLNEKYTYNFDYDEQGIDTNIAKKPFDAYLALGKWGKYLYKALNRKYFYPGPAYMHNLAKSKCYLGLGYIFSSLRTADCWGAGTVLINFSLEKSDYGIPFKDGYNYVSIGERDEMSEDNIHFNTKFKDNIINIVESILDNSEKQKEMVKNQKETYQEYYASPKQFVKKIFIEKFKQF